MSSSGSSDFEGSIGDSSSSSHMRKINRNYSNILQDEFNKAIPPTFNGEINTSQEDESWILGMNKYFQVQDYSGNMKTRVSIFNMNGRASIWWEHLRQVKKINDINIVWK